MRFGKVLSGWMVLMISFFSLTPASAQTIMIATLQYSPPPAVPQKKDPRELVLRIRYASVEELKSLSFLELNLLKNAVYASKGYRFADDRPWLNEVFCGGAKKKAVKKKAAKRPGEAPEVTTVENKAPLPEAANNKWNLNSYAFPACQESGPLDEDQKKAIANTRVATMKKLEAISSIAEVDTALNKEVTPGNPYKGPVWILGKEVSFNSLLAFGYVSMRRDLHGMNRMLQIMKAPEDFDPMELLGLFMGDVIFLRNVIEAKHGKPFPGVQGWEISQFIGVVEQKASYDVKALPADVQQRILKLEDIASKIQRSDLNDVPAAFKNRPIEFNDPYDYEGC